MGTLLSILAGTPASTKALPRHVETHCDCACSDSSDNSTGAKCVEKATQTSPRPPTFEKEAIVG
jgi:hypothetical protein